MTLYEIKKFTPAEGSFSVSPLFRTKEAAIGWAMRYMTEGVIGYRSHVHFQWKWSKFYQAWIAGRWELYLNTRFLARY